jgi:hypothetical protein
MSDAQSSNHGKLKETRIEWTRKYGNTLYELFVSKCADCDGTVRRLLRTSGASISVYQISSEDFENLEEYVEALHESFAADVETKLVQLRHTLADFNSRGLFEAEGLDVFHVRLIDKARLILSRFSKNGQLQRVLDDPDNMEDDVIAAFLLGCLATENYWIETHQEAVFEGYAHIEGRESGRPLATAARLRQGKRTRRAVVEAAARIYKEDPLLRRNDSKTASLIEDMRLEGLRKGDGTYLGCEAIIKHLRAARRDDRLLGKSQ